LVGAATSTPYVSAGSKSLEPIAPNAFAFKKDHFRLPMTKVVNRSDFCLSFCSNQNPTYQERAQVLQFWHISFFTFPRRK
jgi:hypothetical protein